MSHFDDFITKLTTDPAHASRTVIASFVIAAVTMLGWQGGSGQLSASLLRGDIGAADTVGGSAEMPTNTTNAGASTCSAESSAADTFVTQFEASFNGPLPGIGTLLSRTNTEDRKKKLIAAAIRKYANLKYCIPSEAFDGQGDPVSGHLDAYARAKGQADGQVSSDGRVLGSYQSQIEAAASADINAMTAHIDGVITAAAESAKRLDADVEGGLRNLSSSTQVKILAMQAALIDVNNEITNRMLEQNNDTNELLRQQALLLNRLADYAGWDHRKDAELKVFIKGTPEYDDQAGATLKNDLVKKDDIRYTAQRRFDTNKRNLDGLAEVKSAAKIEIANASMTSTSVGPHASVFRYGLLNLLSPSERTAFLADDFKTEAIKYFAFKFDIDIYTPGQEHRSDAAELPTPTPPADQLCQIADSTGTTCFGAK